MSESAMPLKLKEFMKGSALSPMAMFALIFHISSLSLCFGLSHYFMVHSSFRLNVVIIKGSMLA